MVIIKYTVRTKNKKKENKDIYIYGEKEQMNIIKPNEQLYLINFFVTDYVKYNSFIEFFPLIELYIYIYLVYTHKHTGISIFSF